MTINTPMLVDLTKFREQLRSELTLMTLMKEIETVEREGESELATVGNADALEQFRIKFLGTKGRVKGLMTLLGQVPREKKQAVGQRVNVVKDHLTAAFEAKRIANG